MSSKDTKERPKRQDDAEPLWARTTSDIELKKLCRRQKVALHGGETRSQLVGLCDPAAFARRKLEQLYAWDETTSEMCKKSKAPESCRAEVVQTRVDNEIEAKCRANTKGGTNVKAKTRDEWDACLVNSVKDQPEWSLEMTDTQLRVFCRAAGLDGDTDDRKKLVTCASPFFTRHAKLHKAELYKKYEAVTGMHLPDNVTKRELLRYVAQGEARALVRSNPEATTRPVLKTSKMSTPSQKPSTELDIDVVDQEPDVVTDDLHNWAKNVSNSDLRQYCRLHKIAGADAMRRDQLVSACATPLFERTKRKTTDELKTECKSKLPENATKPDYVKCVIDQKLGDWKQERTQQYATLGCKIGERRPSVVNDTFNDCPSGFRRSSTTKTKGGKVGTGCCVASLKAQTRRIINRGRAIDAFSELVRKSVPTRTDEELDADLDASTCTPEQRADLMREQKEADAELTGYLKDQKQENPRDYLLIVNLAAIIQDELRKQMVATVELMESMKKELGEHMADEKTKQEALEKKQEESKTTKEEPGLLRRSVRNVGNALWWGGATVVAMGSSVLGIVSAGVKKLAALGLDFVRWMVRDPRTTKIVTFIAIEMKKRMCRDLSIEFGLIHMREEMSTSETIKTTAKEGLDKLKKILRLAVGDVLRELSRGPWIGKFLAQVNEFTTHVMTKSLVWLVGGAAVATTGGTAMAVGGATIAMVGAMFSVFSSALEEAAKLSIEVVAFKDDVTKTVGQVAELLDFSACFQIVTLTEQELAAHKQSSALSGLGKKGAVLFDEWVNPWISETNRKRLDAFVRETRREITAQSARRDYLQNIVNTSGEKAAEDERERLEQMDAATLVRDQERVAAAEAAAAAKAQKKADQVRTDYYREQEGTVRGQTWVAEDKKWRAQWDLDAKKDVADAVADARRAMLLEIEREKLALVAADTGAPETPGDRKLADRAERDRRKRERFDKLNPVLRAPTVQLGDRFGTRTDAPAILDSARAPRAGLGTYLRSFVSRK